MGHSWQQDYTHSLDTSDMQTGLPALTGQFDTQTGLSALTGQFDAQTG